MRNLKRVLSLALATVMLLGMMIVGASAADVGSFKDADSIVNTEAAAITVGLGIFDGDGKGNFMPQQSVTRAQMAAIITKLLYGSKYNADSFKGISYFSDTASYEGGWAEGYINVCAQLGIVSGKGDNKFAPGDTVTTAEASLMLMKALGYFDKKNPQNEYGDNWALAAMSKADQLGLRGGVVMQANQPLTRDNVSLLVYNTLFAQRASYSEQRGVYTKANDYTVAVNNGTDDPSNTLAQNTFGLYEVEGVVVANGYTDKALAGTASTEEQTRVLFGEAIDLNKDGKVDVKADETYDFECTTGLDLIGHSTKIYYQIVKKSPVVFAITDQATLVKHVVYNKNNTLLSDAATEAGFKRNSVLAIEEKDYIVNFDFDTPADTAVYGFGTDNAAISSQINGKDLILISNSGNLQVDYVIVLDEKLDVLDGIDEVRGQTEYGLKLYGGALNRPLADNMAEKDYVITIDIGKRGDVVDFYGANVIDASITKLTGRTNASADITKVTADGTDYVRSAVDPSDGSNELKDQVVAFADITKIGSATLILDYFGDLIAIEGKPSVPNYAYVAEYGERHSTSGLNTRHALTAKVYFADGTSGVYEVDIKNSDALWYKNGTSNVALTDAYFQEHAADIRTALNGEGTSSKDFRYLKNKSLDADNTFDTDKHGIAARGLYNVTVNPNGTIQIDEIITWIGENVNDRAYKKCYDNKNYWETGDEPIQLVTGHSTLLTKDGSGKTVNVKTTENIGGKAPSAMYNEGVLYQNNSTVYFYVSALGGELTVVPKIGVKNAVSFTNGVNPNYDKQVATFTGIDEAFASLANDRAVITAMLITNVDMGDTSKVYYHDQEQYYVTEAADAPGKYTVTYVVYDAKTGEQDEITYDNGGNYYGTVSAAKAAAKAKYDGFYTLGARDLAAYAAQSDGVDAFKMETKSGVTYVTNDYADYDEYVDNLFGLNSMLGAIVDQEEIEIVDICDSGLNTVRKLVNAIREAGANKGTINISFTWNSKYETFVIFVTEYEPDRTVIDPVKANISGVERMTLPYNISKANTKLMMDVGKAYVLAADGNEATLRAELGIGNTSKRLGDIIFFRFNAHNNSADYGTTAVLTVKDGSGQTVYAESGTVTAGNSYFFSMQWGTSAGSTQFTNPASGAGSAAGANGVARPLASGTYTWTIMQGTLELASGTFVIK